MMEKRLRTKFTFLSVCTFFIVLILISSALIFANYSKLVDQADSSLAKIINNMGDAESVEDENPSSDERRDGDKGPGHEEQFFGPYFTVRIYSNDSETQVDTSHIYAVSVNDAKSYANKIKKNLGGDSEGYGFVHGYRYMIQKTNNGYICAFLSCDRDLDLFKEFIRNNVLIALASLLIISIMSWLLSKRAVSPLVSAYEKQKEFITNASHELKTPLAIISANNDIIEIENGSSKWISSNKGQIKKLSSMIDMLVTLTKLDESSKLENASSVDIASLLNSSIEGFAPLAEAQGKSFNVSAPETLTSKVNYEEIKKLFSILIENSIKYSSDNGAISIELKSLDGDSSSKHINGEAPIDHFSFSISNYSENLEKGSYDVLFDRFYRLDSSRNSETGGFGIGLSIAKAIVQKHGGEIKAFSPDGERMVFKLEI